jgi:cation diffusion facilitator CzcD-associated flavoprotein CzcO
VKAQNDKSATDLSPDFEVVIIGAGITGLQQLYWIKKMGLSVRLFEAGSGVGGTWYWNRYPGSRLDSESQSYAFSFSEELLQEWDWEELFASQPELERHMNYIADRFHMRPDIQLNTEVVAATWNEDERLWDVTLDSGDHVTCRFVLAAVGVLSALARYVPDFPGIDSFEGETYHSAYWPHEEVSFEGKRVGVIGTGSTGVQIIQTIAPLVGHLTVFQRTPTYIGPLLNSPVQPETQAEWKRTYPEIFARCAVSPKGFIHIPDPRKAMDVPRDERMALYESYWALPGFQKYQSIFHDVFSDPVANTEYCDFIRDKIREIVHDPAVTEKLLPAKDLPFASRRIPLSAGYYEAYNQPNVLLIDVREAPIERITPKGVQTADGEYELDMIIFATGFDSFTGGFTRIDVRGVDGLSLKEKWDKHGPVNYLSMMTAGFPNFFTLVSRLAGNFARTTDLAVRWVTDTLQYLYDHRITRIVPTQEAEDKWVEHELGFAKSKEFLTRQNSWFNGGNIPGKKIYPPYHNSFPAYIKELTEVANSGYAGFELTGGAEAPEQDGKTIPQVQTLAFSEANADLVGRVDNIPI